MTHIASGTGVPIVCAVTARRVLGTIASGTSTLSVCRKGLRVRGVAVQEVAPLNHAESCKKQQHECQLMTAVALLACTDCVNQNSGGKQAMTIDSPVRARNSTLALIPPKCVLQGPDASTTGTGRLVRYALGQASSMGTPSSFCGI